MAVPIPSNQQVRRTRSVRNRILVESVEVNVLVYAYLVESGLVASATAFRSETQLDTSPLFGILRPDLVDIRCEANPTGENIIGSSEKGNASDGAVPGSARKRTTSGKDLQEARAAAKAAVENNRSMSPGQYMKEKEAAREAKEGQKGRPDADGSQRLLPRDELIAYLQRGLLWQEAVQHANDDVLDNCMAEFRLLKPHTCTPPASRKFLRTLPCSVSRARQAAGTQANDSEIDRALQLQSQNAMKDLPVFSALRDMHMQEQAPERPPPRTLPPPALLIPVPTKEKEHYKEKAPKTSSVSQDIEMPLVSDSEKSNSTRARILLSEISTKTDIESEKSKPRDKDGPSKVSQLPNGKSKLPVADDQKETSQLRENKSTPLGKSPRDPTSAPRGAKERKTSLADASPQKGRQTDETSRPSAQEKAKGKDREIPELARDKDSVRKKAKGYFFESDEEEGPVIKRRKIMGGVKIAESGDRDVGLKPKKVNVEKERGHAEKERADDGRNPAKAADKKQKLALDERRSRQGTPTSDKSRSTSTTVKEKRPKPDPIAPSRDRSLERERKLIAGRARKNSQTSTSTRTGNDATEDVETPIRPEKRKKAEGKSKAGGKPEINPLLPLSKEGALIWKWKGVHKRVLKVAWSPNLNKLAACSFDGHCGIFDFEDSTSSNEAGKLKALAKTPYKCSHRGIESLKPVTDVNWNPEGTLLGTICDDGVARTFTPDGSLNSILTRHAGPIRHLAFNVGVNRDEGILVTAGSDGLICTWNLDNGNVKWQLNYHMPNQAYFVDFMDGQIFATCSEDTTIGLCSTKSGNPLMILKGHSDRVLMVRFSPAPRNDNDKSRRLLASASEDKTIRIWDVEGLVAKGAELFASMGGSYNERLAAAKGLDSTSRPSSAGIKAVPARDEPSSDEATDIPSPILKLEGHDYDVTLVQWDPQGVRKDGKRLLLSASQCNDDEADEDTYKTGHSIKMYDINAKSSTTRCLYTLRDHEATINAVAFSPDGDKFASVSDDHTMVVWDTLTGAALRRYETDTQLNDVCWRYDGKQLAIAAEDSTIRTFYVGDL